MQVVLHAVVTGKHANVAVILVHCGEPLISSVSSPTLMQIRVFIHNNSSGTPVEPARWQHFFPRECNDIMTGYKKLMKFVMSEPHKYHILDNVTLNICPRLRTCTTFRQLLEALLPLCLQHPVGRS